MAHPHENKETVRRKYIFEQLSLEMAAMCVGVPVATARKWKSDARDSGDDWDKLRAAHIMAGDGVENLAQTILMGFLIQYQSTIEQITLDGTMKASDKVDALAKLADAYNKVIAANRRAMPETDRLAVAMETMMSFGDFVKEYYPDSAVVFVELLEKFAPLLGNIMKD